MKRTADFSPCRTWRYRLRREWLIGSGRMLAVLLNPSKAGAHRDDPTTTFMCRLAQREGFRSYEAVNCFAIVGTDPAILKQHPNPVGPLNDSAIRLAAREADGIVIAWGNHGAYMDRSSEVLSLLEDYELMCFGVTKANEPRFPRALRSDIPLIPWRRNDIRHRSTR